MQKPLSVYLKYGGSSDATADSVRILDCSLSVSRAACFSASSSANIVS